MPKSITPKAEIMIGMSCEALEASYVSYDFAKASNEDIAIQFLSIFLEWILNLWARLWAVFSFY